MKVTKEISIEEFDRWSCGQHIDIMFENLSDNELCRINDYFDSVYPDGIDETELNDIIRFEFDDLLEAVGIDADELLSRNG